MSAIKQKQGDLSGRQFAAGLGMSCSMLCLLYAGKRKPGRKTLSNIVKKYPDLKPHIDEYIWGYSDGTSEGTETITALKEKKHARKTSREVKK